MHPKLAWVDLLRGTLAEVMGTSIVASTRECVDPLKRYVVLDLGAPLTKGNYNPMQVIVHAYSKANDCVVVAIRREGLKRLVLETLIKNRVSPEMKNDPFEDQKEKKNRSDKTEPPKEG